MTVDVPPMVSVPQPTQAGDGPVRDDAEATGGAGTAAATVPGGRVCRSPSGEMRATIPAAVNPAGTTGCPDAVRPRTRFFDIRRSSSLIRTGQVVEACTRTGAVRRARPSESFISTRYVMTVSAEAADGRNPTQLSPVPRRISTK